jgi:hypothetical protein
MVTARNAIGDTNMLGEEKIWSIEEEDRVELDKKAWAIGLSVRVRPEVERVLREYADKTGWLPHSVRNVAILLGLLALAKGLAKFPQNVKQYERLLEEVVKRVEEMEYA